MTREILAFTLLTLSLLLKQAIIFHVFTVCMGMSRKKWVGVALTACAVGFFALSYVPFMPGAWAPTRDTMNRYSGILGTYGFSYLAFMICGQCSLNVLGMYFWVFFRNVFMLAMGSYIFFWRHKDLMRTCLLVTLFFYTFTPGIAPQYFVYPLIFGALFPSKWFLLYSAVTGLFLMGHWDELGIVPLQTVNYNIVWITVVLWYASELVRTSAFANRLYVKVSSLVRSSA